MISLIKKGILALLVACAMSGIAVYAEVGVVYESGVPIRLSGPYVLSIIEDGDPVTAAWSRHSPALGTRQVLNENGSSNGDGLPSAVFNSTSNLPIVTWGRYNGSGFDIVESHFQNGAWTPPTLIVASVSTAMDPEPSISLDAQTGEVHIVYFAADAAPKVMYTQAPADLSSWTPAAQVSQPGDIAMRPHAVIHQGTLTVAYESHGSGVGSTPRQILVATSDGLGGFTYDTISATHFGDPNRPHLHTGASPSLWIDWIDDTNDMAWATWQPGTGWGAIQLEPFSDLEDREYHARGRIDGLVTQ
jgi:hypothetical protein